MAEKANVKVGPRGRDGRECGDPALEWGRNFRSPSWLVTSLVVARSDATIDFCLLHHDPASVSTHLDETQVEEEKRDKGN